MADGSVTPARGRPIWGIRRRIVVGYLALVAVALVASLFVTRQALRARLDVQIDDALAQEVEELRALARDGIDPETGEAIGDDVEAVLDKFLSRNVPADHEAFYTLVGGQPFQASFGAPTELLADGELVGGWSAATEPRFGSADTSAGAIRYLVNPVEVEGRTEATFIVVYFPADDLGEIDDIFGVEARFGLAVFVAAAALAWSASARIVQPVRALTEVARGINESDLSARIPTVGADELTELGRTFNDMLDRLEAGFTGQRQFLDDVAHELRTPITIVQGHLELMGDDPDERRETVELVGDELNRMRRSVDDLLLLAKAETTEFLRPRPVDVGELALALHTKVTALGPRDWQLDTAPDPGTLAVIADPDRLSQVVLNLATNALEHSEPGSEVGLGFEPIPDRAPDGSPGLRMWVRDQGRGLEPGLAEHLFDRRHRGAASRVRRHDGLGLGLAIVSAVVRAHGGSVRAADQPEGGARFVVEVPPEPSAAGVDDPGNHPTTGPDGSSG